MARCNMFWTIAGMMMAYISDNYLKLMYLPMLEDINVVRSYSWGSATLVCLYVTTCLVVLNSRFYFWKNRLRRRTPRRTVMGTTDRRKVSLQNT